MKKIVSIITVLLAVLFVQAQTITQNGVSYRYNGKNPRTPIGGVYIKPVTADNGVVSNASNGSFSVVLKNLKMGSRIGNVKVTKQGMMVFNQQAVDEWNVRKDPLCLILCDANEFQKQKKNLIAIGERQAKLKYDKKLAELKKKNEAQQLQIDDYYNKLDSLEKEYQNALKHMDEYADVFARIDESEVDTLAQRAIELFNKGEIDESIRLFEQGNYMKKLDDALHTKAQAQNLRNVADSAEALADKDIEEYVKSIKAQVSAYQVRNNYEKVGELLKGMADKLQTSDAIWDYILFCKMQNKFKEEELYSYKIFQLIEQGNYQKKEILLLPLYISLGDLSCNLQDFSDSENILKTALEICCRQSKDNPDLEPGLLFIYKSLGQLYQKMHRLGESEAMYKSELEVYERLSKNNPKVYEPELADLYVNLGVLYYDLHRFSDSEAMYKSALEIRKRLAVDNPKVHEPELATSYNNLGVLYNNLQRFSDSEAMYKSALEIQKRLATDNPKAYEPELASSYNNLGILYCDIKRFSDSEAMHKSALEISKRLAIDYPKAYEEDLASSYNNLGNLYYDTERFNDSEAMYKSALEIRKRLATDNPKVYEPELATSYNNLGVLYNDLQRFSDSEAMYKSALEIRKRLAVDSPKVYEPGLATSYNNLGNLYYDTKRFNDSEIMEKSSLEILEHLSKDNPDVYESNIATCYDKLGSIYSKMQRFTDSETMYKLALEIRKRLSKNNPKVYDGNLAASYNNLGVLYCTIQRYTDSEAMYKLALEIRKRLATDNPKAYEEDLASSYNNLGLLYRKILRFSDSETMYKLALEIIERLSKDNPKDYEDDLIGYYTNLGNLYRATERFGDSEKIFLSCLDIYSKMYENNPQSYGKKMANLYYNIGTIRTKNRKNIMAINAFENSLKLIKKNAIREKEDSALYAVNLQELIKLYNSEKNYEAAYNYNAELLKILKSDYLVNPEKFKNAYTVFLSSQSFYTNLLGKFKEGETYCLEALQVDSTKHIAYTNLAAALLFQGKIEEAEKIYRQYKAEFKDGFLDDFAEYERLQVIPKEYMADVERIKAMLQE